MIHACTTSIRAKPTLRNSIDMRERCPECGEWLRIRPDVQRAVSLASVLTFWVPTFLRPNPSLVEMGLALIGMLVVVFAGGWLAVRFLPMQHMSATDRAAYGYRSFLGAMLAVALAIAVTYLVVQLRG